MRIKNKKTTIIVKADRRILPYFYCYGNGIQGDGGLDLGFWEGAEGRAQ